MITVPKLNYANMRNKSKSKDQQYSDRKIENASSDLFSQMNKDNLKYIQSQIKQKNKKNISISQQKNGQQQENQEVDTSQYPTRIQEKQSKLEQTQREPVSPQLHPHQLKVIKTDGESIKYLASNSEANEKLSEDHDHKLSYYDLVSQAKSKRVSSIEGYYQQQQKQNSNKQTGKFLDFLSEYIEDLNKNKSKNIKEEEKKKKIGKQRKELEIQNSRTNSSFSEKEILKKSLADQRMKNIYMAKQIQDRRVEEETNRKRIENLEDFVTRLAQQLQNLKMNNLPKRAAQKNYRENIKIYNEGRDENYISHRKDNTSFSLHSDQFQRYNYRSNNYNHMANKHNQSIKNGNQTYMKSSATSRKMFNEEINLLEKQYEIFRETGECRILGRRSEFD